MSEHGNPSVVEHPSKTRQTLEDARHDLANSELKGVLGYVFNPFRYRVLYPTLRVATDYVPPIVSRIPYADDVCAVSLRLSFQAVRLGYRWVPHSRELDYHAREEAVHDAIDGLNQTTTSSSVNLQFVGDFSNVGAMLLSVTGFVANFALDVITSPGKKVLEWFNIAKVFIGYLLFLGIDNELASAFINTRVVENIAITARIQNDLDRDALTNRRNRALSTDTPSDAETKQIVEEGAGYLRYAVAAYGIFEIQAAEMNGGGVQEEEESALEHWLHLPGHLWGKATDTITNYFESLADIARRDRLINYLGIEDEDLIYLTEPGGDPILVRHFVAIDNTNKAVVLAIRGTYCASDILTDILVMSTDFCGGRAHRGFVERALTLWNNPDTAAALQRGFELHPDYRLVLVGHSLGAGIASLLTIKHYYDNNPREVQCYGYGSPPVYWLKPLSASSPELEPMRASVQQAISKTVCFINGADTIPFLSVDSIRRLAFTLNRVDEVTRHMDIFHRLLLARGGGSVPQELIDIVKEASEDLAPVFAGERLQVAAHYVIWYEKEPDDSTFDYKFCSPKRLANLSILLDRNMIFDHMAPGYEDGVLALGAPLPSEATQ